MTYIPDGASKDYHNGEDEKYYAWGWLDSDHEFPTGWDDKFLKRKFLRTLEKYEIVDRYRGWHTDEGLGLTRKNTSSHPGSDEKVLTNGSIKFEFDGTVYTAPVAVTYYIRELDYRPPEKVIKALL